jgi:hypothetical protein
MVELGIEGLLNRSIFFIDVAGNRRQATGRRRRGRGGVTVRVVVMTPRRRHLGDVVVRRSCHVTSLQASRKEA